MGTIKKPSKPKSRVKATPAVLPTTKTVARKLYPPTVREIASRAYALYAEAGHQGGREVEFWLEAERQLQKSPKK